MAAHSGTALPKLAPSHHAVRMWYHGPSDHGVPLDCIWGCASSVVPLGAGGSDCRRKAATLDAGVLYPGRLAPARYGIEAVGLVLVENSRIWWPGTRRRNRAQESDW